MSVSVFTLKMHSIKAKYYQNHYIYILIYKEENGITKTK